ncbi:hypothetical protein KAR91_80690 [Candidatus Pacearchaeota archaeon]|nr:hypothetical protein [Candidatus Pacearchaeota archaeon]
MSDIIPLSFTHRLRCHHCKSNAFEIQLDSDAYRNGTLIATGAVCKNCGKGYFDMLKPKKRGSNETQQGRDGHSPE